MRQFAMYHVQEKQEIVRTVWFIVKSRRDNMVYVVCMMCIVVIVIVVLACLYTEPNPPKLSIEEFSVPAFNKTSDQISGDIYIDLKLRNMNKAAGLYYDDPFTLAFSYYPIDEPYQKYVWEYTVPPFYQGNGKSKHIITLIGNHLRPPSMVVEEQEDTQEVVETDGKSYEHVRSLLRNQLQLPSSMVVYGEDDGKSLTETRRELNSTPAEVVSFRVDLMFSYRFKLLADHNTHVLEMGADVIVDANSGERVSKGSIQLVVSAAAATGGPVLAVVLFTSFLFVSI
ncbi:uncharacterized protein LOC112499602 [Cynara cardunculus var. scolymus]|uniref:uncharacterized protein LOC112499602 n=1 Tax=Cynara cardunculus var. scolymus TaxID=59895 RepID=UPI000D6277EF|nr:uncharacterized protein LOC112499602 [Cynara cardunculus var. scolymus]